MNNTIETENPANTHKALPKVNAVLRQSISSLREVENSLSVGETILLQGKLSNNSVKAMLTGWILDECVIVHPPLAVLAAGQFVKDELLLARYLLLGNVFGFETTVRKIVLDPPLIALHWPLQVEVASISRETRMQARKEILLTLFDYNNNPKAIPATLIEISKGGCRVKVAWKNDVMEFCVPNSPVELTLDLFRNNNPVIAQATVRNFTKQGGLAILGLQFQNNNEEFEKNLDMVLNVQLIHK
jgi:hypothetical protein